MLKKKTQFVRVFLGVQKGNCDPQVRNQTLKIKSLSDYRKSIVNNINIET